MAKLFVATPGNLPVAKNWWVVSMPFQMAKLCWMPASRLATVSDAGCPSETARQFVFQEMFFPMIRSWFPAAGGHLILRIVCRSCLTQSRKSLTRSGGVGFTVAAVRDVAIAWFTLGGLYLAISFLPLSAELHHNVGRGLLVLVILSATVIAARVASDAIKVYALRTTGVMQASSIFITVGRLLIYIVGFLILLQTFGISIAPILTALGVGGLAVALALQDTLANLFAGVHLLASRKIKIGDYVALESGQEGYVVDINWRNTSIRLRAASTKASLPSSTSLASTAVHAVV